MKITILGSGTVVPDGNRNSAGYFVDLGHSRLMLDCGAGTVHALARYRVDWEQMTHLFISHFHIDHVGELASLFQAFKYGMKTDRVEPLTVVGPAGLDQLTRGLRLAFGENTFEPKFPVRFLMLAPGESLQLADHCRLSVAKTPHTEESLAIRIDDGAASFCYTGDTGYSDELATFFRGADLLISECSFKERRAGVPHLTIGDAAMIARNAGVRRLVVTHFYFEVDEAALKSELEKDYAGDVIIGRDGMEITI
ncbi:MAG TPA: ribonuclease Z [Blastocatellia bacterium]|nr:ribonuclease Z [Blastocatellia bacterium]